MFSFCFLVHNEGQDYLNKLFNNMYAAMQPDDEIIICDDNSTEETTINFLKNLQLHLDLRVKIFKHSLNNNFAEHKNFLISKCIKNYIFLMDADEYLTIADYNNIRNFVMQHPNNDMFSLHRTNLLTNYTSEYIDVINGFRNYPNKIIDNTTIQVVTNCYQQRIWKNFQNIKYINNVHEMLINYYNNITIDESIATIKHIKTCEKQRSQNKLYNMLQGG